MKLECSIRIEDQMYPQYSLKRFVNCNLYVGVMKTSNASFRGPQIYLRTGNCTYQYNIVGNIESVRGKNENNVPTGKATIKFVHPKHYLMINSEKEKLLHLLKLLRYLSAKKSISPADVTVIKDLKKPASGTKPTNTYNPILFQEISNTSSSVIAQLKQYPSLWGTIMNNLQALVLKDLKKIKFPVILGQLSLLHVNLTNMGLRNDDLLWLNELQIRDSLKTLCLSHNELSEFPSAVIDCQLLDSLDLNHNRIHHIPHDICRLQKLRILKLSHNNLHFLPADITFLKLESIDLSFNRLYSNVAVDISRVDFHFYGRLRLEDWASLNVDPRLRFQLTAKDCPNNILRKLRTLSRCVCNKRTPRYLSTEYFVPLTSVKFSASSWIEPQYTSPEECSRTLFLQYNFCTFQNHCIDKKFQNSNSFRLVRVTS